MYILECADGSYYTGSTKKLDRRITQHRTGEGANYTAERGPLKIVYFEKFARIDDAFSREKQIQRWSHAKKSALINGDCEELRKKAKKNFGKYRGKEKSAGSSVRACGATRKPAD
jgi:putative endonuclease